MNRCTHNFYAWNKALILIPCILYISYIDAAVKIDSDSQYSAMSPGIYSQPSIEEISSTVEEDKSNTNRSAIGEAPADETSHDLSRLFLRDSEVLLNPREIQLSIGFDYNTDEIQRSFRTNRSRSISLAFNISYGLTKKLEINASLPMLYNENEIVSATNVSKSSNSGAGDLSLGMSYKLKSESKTSPSVTTSLNVTTPTGETADPFDLDELSSGSGFWGTSTDINLSKTIDPAIVFFNIGYQHTIEDDQFGSNIQPGNSLNYGFGAGLSVNSAVAFSARISGSYQKDTKIDKKRVRGTSSEPILLIGSMSYRLHNKTRLETTLNLGASDSANDVGMGFSYIWNF